MYKIHCDDILQIDYSAIIRIHDNETTWMELTQQENDHEKHGHTLYISMVHREIRLMQVSFFKQILHEVQVIKLQINYFLDGIGIVLP